MVVGFAKCGKLNNNPLRITRERTRGTKEREREERMRRERSRESAAQQVHMPQLRPAPHVRYKTDVGVSARLYHLVTK